MKKATQSEERSRPRKANPTTPSLTKKGQHPEVNKSFPMLAKQNQSRYGLTVAANSATGFGDPMSKRRTSAPSPKAGAFFVSAICVYGGCAWETERSAGILLPRFANLRTAATLNRLATISGSSPAKGATPMKIFPARNTSSHAAAWKARARAALRSDSSLSVRLTRYNEAMAKARALEAGEVSQ